MVLHGKKFGAAAAFAVVALPHHGFKRGCSATFETAVASKSGTALLSCMWERCGPKAENAMILNRRSELSAANLFLYNYINRKMEYLFRF